MTLTVYNVQSDPDHLQQTLPASAVGTYTGAARDPVSVDTPVIMVQAQILTGNYAHIPEFGRYYWIREKNVLRDDLSVLTLESDPCMSFAAGIKGLPVYALRTSKIAESETSVTGYNADIPDSKVQCEQAARSKNIYVASLPIQNAIYLVAVG